MPNNLFTPNMPAAGNSLGYTRPLVLGNFANYRENMEVNHFGVNSVDFGKHKFMQMPEQAAAPTTAADEGALYSKLAGGQSQLFWRQESDGGEFGMAFLKGQATYTGPGVEIVPLFDFTGYPNCYGLFEARANTHTDQYRVLVAIYIANSTYNTYYFTNGSLGPLFAAQANTGTAIGSVGFTGAIFNAGITSGLTPATTINWTFTHTMYPST